MRLLKYKEFEFLTEQNSMIKIKKKEFLEAAEQGNLSIIELYVKQKGDLEVKYKYFQNGSTALVLASYEHFHIVKYLVENGADIESTDNNGKAALSISAIRGNIDILEYLIKKGADVNKRDQDDSTALISSSYKNDVKIIQCLIDNGANINAKNSLGCTALMYACQYNNIEVVECLIGNGADVTIKDIHGITVIKYARNPEIIKMIEDPKGYQIHKKLEPTMTKIQKNSNIF